MQALISPTSVAILGCSGDLQRVNGRPLRYLQERGYKGRIYPVNPKYTEIAGLRCYPDVAAIAEPVDLAVIALPAAVVLDGVRQVAAKGIPAAVIFTSGFAETGPDGAARQRELVTIARRGGVRILGPNCVGMLNSFEGVAATFSEYLEGPTPTGPVGFVSQSGAFGTGIAALARLRGIGVGLYVNTGNEADLDFADAIAAVAEDPRIRVVACYAEGIRDGRKLLAAAERAMELGKPIIMTKVGRTASGARAAASHTGALAGADAVLDGVCSQAGIIRVDDEEHLLDLVEMFIHSPLPSGNRLGVVSQSGGAGVLICDRAEQQGLDVSALSADTQARLRKVLPAYAAVGNPVDVTGQSLAEPQVMQRAMEIVLNDPAIDVGVLWLRLMDNYVQDMIDIIEHVRRRTAKTFVVSWLAAPAQALTALRSRGICVSRAAVPAVDAIAGMVRYAEARDRRLASREHQRRPPPVPDLPSCDGPVGTLDAAGLLSRAGIPVISSEFAADADAAVAAAARLGYPVAVKIESRDLLHKSDAGGVVLGVADESELRGAVACVVQKARRHDADARLDGVVIQTMAHGGVELVVGARQDPSFGPVVMVGLGGVLIEVLHDVVFAAAPVTPIDAERMLSRLRGAAVLDGVRGRPAVDRAAVCELLVKVSELALAAGPRLTELDLNPVMADADGVVAVDWLMMLASPGAGTDGER